MYVVLIIRLFVKIINHAWRELIKEIPQKKKWGLGFNVAEEVEEYDQEELQALLVMGEGVQDVQKKLVELLASHGEGEDHKLPRNIS